MVAHGIMITYLKGTNLARYFQKEIFVCDGKICG
jgi:hypothetical protein